MQSSTAVTHSYTVQPVIYEDGSLASLLYVLMVGSSGQFPSCGIFRTPNLFLQASRSHIMTKERMLDWARNVLFHSAAPQHCLLLVDSWPAFKDHSALQSAATPGKELTIMNIPAGCTSLCQPLDIGWFRTMKAVLKRFSSHVHANDLPFQLSKRDNVLKLISLMYHQFSQPRFRHFNQYAWFKAGIVPSHPPPFLSPLQFCFDLDMAQECEDPQCSSVAFIRCAGCEVKLCFTHFVEEFHYC